MTHVRLKPAIDAEEAFLLYQRGLVSLARLGELLGIDRQDAIEFVESRGETVIDGPMSREELLADISAIRRTRSS